MSGSVASSSGGTPLGAWGNFLPNASPSPSLPPNSHVPASSPLPPSRAGEESGLAMSIYGAPLSADPMVSAKENDTRRSLEGTGDRGSAESLDRRAEEALADVTSKGGRALYREGFVMNDDGVARLVAERSGLSAGELLQVNPENVSESLMRQGAIFERNQAAIETQVGVAPAMRVALETRDAAVDALRTADANIANAQEQVSRLQVRMQAGGSVSRQDLIRALEGSGIRAQDLGELKLEDGMVVAGSLVESQRVLASLAQTSERMQSTYTNVHFSERTMLVDPRFESIRAEVMAREGVSSESAGYQRSVDALGQPFNARQVLDDAAAIASKAPGIGGLTSTLWSGATAIFDVAMSPTKELEARVLYSAGLVEESFVEDASDAAMQTLWRTVASTAAGKSSRPEASIMAHMMMRDGGSPLMPDSK